MKFHGQQGVGSEAMPTTTCRGGTSRKEPPEQQRLPGYYHPGPTDANTDNEKIWLNKVQTPRVAINTFKTELNESDSFCPNMFADLMSGHTQFEEMIVDEHSSLHVRAQPSDSQQATQTNTFPLTHISNTSTTDTETKPQPFMTQISSKRPEERPSCRLGYTTKQQQCQLNPYSGGHRRLTNTNFNTNNTYGQPMPVAAFQNNTNSFNESNTNMVPNQTSGQTGNSRINITLNYM